MATDTGVLVGVRRLPALEVTLTTNPLEVTGALGVTVTETVLSTGLVAREATHTTIGLHGDEVEGAVHAAGDSGQVHVESKLVSGQVEHLVGRRVGHEVETGAGVGAVLVLGLVLEGDGVARGGDAVRLRVLGTLDGAVLSASRIVRACSRVPLITVKAVVRLLKFLDAVSTGAKNFIIISILGRSEYWCKSVHQRLQYSPLQDSWPLLLG